MCVFGLDGVIASNLWIVGLGIALGGHGDAASKPFLNEEMHVTVHQQLELHTGSS